MSLISTNPEVASVTPIRRQGTPLASQSAWNFTSSSLPTVTSTLDCDSENRAAVWSMSSWSTTAPHQPSRDSNKGGLRLYGASRLPWEAFLRFPIPYGSGQKVLRQPFGIGSSRSVIRDGKPSLRPCGAQSRWKPGNRSHLGWNQRVVTNCSFKSMCELKSTKS